jgi:hypothetical protein
LPSPAVADLLVEAAKRGLDGLTLYPSGARWQASSRFRDSAGWFVQIADTPAEAVALALTPPSTQQPDTGVFD